MEYMNIPDLCMYILISYKLGLPVTIAKLGPSQLQLFPTISNGVWLGGRALCEILEAPGHLEILEISRATWLYLGS